MRYPDELLAVAERVVWFEAGEKALSLPKRFLAYLMTYGTLEEILVAKKYFSKGDFDAALLEPVPGIFDKRSWNYWNLVFGHEPVPPLPTRNIP